MATQDMNANMHIMDENGNVNNIYPATKIANVDGLTAALNAKADTTTVTNQLSGKVDKETGKGLSTNDYTTAEKNKLSGIEAQANKTTVDSALSASSENPVQNKVINSALGNKADASTVSALATTVSGKADTSTVSSLSSQVSTNTTNIVTQTARIDAIATLPSGSTSGDAELIDIRTKADGTTATNAGNAVREQFDLVDKAIDHSLSSEYIFAMLDKNYYYDTSGTLQFYDNTGTWGYSSIYIPVRLIKKLKLRLFTGANGVCFYDIGKTYISGITASSSATPSGEPYLLKESDVPNNAAYIRICTTWNSLDCKLLADVRGFIETATEEFPVMVSNGGLLPNGANGNYGDYWTISDYIPVNEHKYLSFTSKGFISVPDNIYVNPVCFYDKNKAFISTVNIDDCYYSRKIYDDNSYLVKGRVAIPAGSVYFRIGDFFHYMDVVASYVFADEHTSYDLNNAKINGIEVSELLNDTLKFRGKTINFIGDSITEGVHTDKTYHQWISEMIGIVNNNYGKNGSTISDYVMEPTDPKYQICDRLDLIDTDAALNVIFAGTNDFYFNVPMGSFYKEISGETYYNDDKKTFKGALSWILVYLKQNMPHVPIVVCTPIHRGEFMGQPTELQTNSLGLHLSDYCEAILEACDIFSVEYVVDLHKLSGLNPLIIANGHEFFHDGTTDAWTDLLHPNAAGHKKIAECIINHVFK